MRSSTARACFSALVAVVGAGCGPAPYAMPPEEPGAGELPAPAPAVYVMVGPGAGQAPPPTAARAQVARPAEDRSIPDGYPLPNPFGAARTWVGSYDCPQGHTGLTLRVIDVRGKLVRAVFDFHHAPTDTSGQYIVGGAFDEQSGAVELEPGPWIIHPDGYGPVGMKGRVSRDGSRFVGIITDPGCGAFQLRAAR